MSVLVKPDIIEYMSKSDIEKRLIITPMYDLDKSVGTTSIDLCLGNQFILIKRQSFSHIDQDDKENIERNLKKYPQKVIINYGEKFYLHPRQLVLGCSFEYMQIPPGLMAYVVGKSTLGRMGLIIATATKIDSGFKGCITLEIINEGEVPIALKPRQKIAQLVIHKTVGIDFYKGKYNCPIGPQPPKF